LRIQHSIPPRIFDRIMRIAINLDDQTFGRTEEIHNERSNDMLPTEFMSAELRPAQMPPKNDLARRRLVTHRFCVDQKAAFLRHGSSPPQPLP